MAQEKWVPRRTVLLGRTCGWVSCKRDIYESNERDAEGARKKGRISMVKKRTAKKEPKC